MKCNLCNRKCNIDRKEKLGFCKSSNKIKIAKAMLYHYEEPCISGTNGSGAIFFSGCNMKCIFCQNYEISQEGYGKEISITDLANICLELQKQGISAEVINARFLKPFDKNTVLKSILKTKFVVDIL